MEIIATIPPPSHRMCHQVGGSEVPIVRFNTGSHGKVANYSPECVLQEIIRKAPDKRICVDIKGRQLRVTKWANPLHGAIVLNHPVVIDLPAKLYLRGEKNPLNITEIYGRTIITSNNPRYGTGDGQAANVIGKNRIIKGTLSGLCKAYILACRKLGISDIYLSYLEKASDLEEVYKLYPKAKITGKVEDQEGLCFIQSEEFEKRYAGRVNLMAARDDLSNELGHNFSIIGALKIIIQRDPEAIVASKILESLKTSELPSLSDLCDLALMKSMGYKRFMLSDEMSEKEEVFNQALSILSEMN